MCDAIPKFKECTLELFDYLIYLLSMTNVELKSFWDKAQSFDAYHKMLLDLMAEGKTTGKDQSEQMIAYSKLNLQRMKRVSKTFHAQPELLSQMQLPQKAVHWLVITEGWCGDAAQLVPAIDAIAALSGGQIETRYLLRDENLALMDQYLTNGSRSIPIVILMDQDFNVIGRWGPRPAVLQQLIQDMRDGGQMSFAQMVEKVHAWYAADQSENLQKEMLELIVSFHQAKVQA